MIEHRELGRSGVNVSRLCAGGLQGSGYSPQRDRDYVRALRAAFDAGVNFIDTAEGYGNGHAEKLAAQAVAGRRAQVVIASKFSHNHSRPRELRRSLEASLKRFKTDYLDLYQQHWPPTSPPLDETIRELEKLKQEGKIRALGVCNWMEPEFAEIDSPARIDVLQSCYSLLWRSIESHTLPLCAKHGLGVIAYSPLCQGVLAGRVFADDPAGIRSANRFARAQKDGALAPLFEELSRLGAAYQKTWAQIALRWLLQKPISGVIVGFSTTAQLEENLGAFGWELTGVDMQRLDDISRPFSAQAGPHESLWGWHSRERYPPQPRRREG